MSLQAAEPLARPAGTLRDAGGWPSAARRTGRRPGGWGGGPSVGRGDRGSLADPLVNDSGGGGAPNGGSRGDSWSPRSPRSPLGRAWRWKGRQVQRQPERQALGIRRPRTERVPAGDTRAAPRARSDGGQHAEGRGAGRSGRSETSQSLPGFRIGAGVQPGDALTAGAAGGLAGRAGRHHVATLPLAVLPRHLMLMLMASRCCGGRRAAPSYVRAAARASAEGTGLPQGHVPFPGQPPSDDSLKEKYQSPPT